MASLQSIVITRKTDMSRTQAFVASLFIFAIMVVGGFMAYVSIEKYRAEVEINAQTEIERTRIEEAERTERAKEHLKWVPWN